MTSQRHFGLWLGSGYMSVVGAGVRVGRMLRVSNHVVLNLVLNYGLIVGCLGGVCIFGAFPLFYLKYKKNALEFQTIASMLYLPWAGKALVGACSDARPVCGWHKRWLLVGSLVTLCFALFGVAASSTAEDAIGFLLLASLSLMVNNTLWEGQYAMLASFARADPRGIAFSWGCYMLGLGAGAILVGALGKVIHVAFYIAAPFALVPVVPLLMRPEDSLPGDRAGTTLSPTLLDDDDEDTPEHTLRKPPSPQEWSLVVWVTGVSAVLLLVLLVAKPDDWIGTTLAIMVAVVSIAAIHGVYRDRPVLLALCVFSLCHQVLYINLEGVTTAFFVASEECWYGGPNFSLLFFYTAVQLVSSIVGVVAAGLHARYIVGWDCRTALIFAIVFRIVSGIFDLVIVQRWNVRYLGINDEVFYLVGDAVAGQAAMILVMLPIKTVAATILPVGRATTSFALLDSFQFLGIAISRVIGGTLAASFDVRASEVTGCNFTQLAVILALAHMVFPILSLALAWGIVPRVKVE